ncbi:hypothetical protein AB0D49_06605 [Streptomyces sp. NPDC048290]|uniref:hypothetical protein n=1 Tax=Streptomyces sp. NPDC048290 TaxID=3155811 RepID=UPI0034413EF0
MSDDIHEADHGDRTGGDRRAPRSGARLAGALSATLAALMVAGYTATAAGAADPETRPPQTPVSRSDETWGDEEEVQDGDGGGDGGLCEAGDPWSEAAPPDEASPPDEGAPEDGSPDEIGPDRVPEVPDVRDGGGRIPDDPDGLVDE